MNIRLWFWVVAVLVLTTSCKQEKRQVFEEVSKDSIIIDKQLQEQEDALSFLVIGDWGRSGEYNQKEVGEVMNACAERMDPEFIISTGDNFYDNGVRSVNDPIWHYSFENVYQGANLQRDWYVILGNHDYRGNPQAEIDYSKVSRRWNMPSRYYTFAKEIDDSTSVRFVFIDTNPFIGKYQKYKEDYSDVAQQDTLKQLKWIDSVLATSKEKWKIVIGHHPIYSGSEKHGTTPELLNTIKPRLEKYHVQLYLSGHDHDLQHLKEENGVVDYVVSGSGSECRPTSKLGITKFAEGVSGFAAATVKKDTLIVNFVDVHGKVIYKMNRGF